MKSKLRKSKIHDEQLLPFSTKSKQLKTSFLVNARYPSFLFAIWDYNCNIIIELSICFNKRDNRAEIRYCFSLFLSLEHGYCKSSSTVIHEIEEMMRSLYHRTLILRDERKIVMMQDLSRNKARHYSDDLLDKWSANQAHSFIFISNKKWWPHKVGIPCTGYSKSRTIPFD